MFRLQFPHEDILGYNAVLDTAQYFKTQMTLADAAFCQKGGSKKDLCHMATLANNYFMLRYHVRNGFC
jgi:hypothetical protein